MVQDGAIWCNMVQHGAMWCKMMQHVATCAIWCKMVQAEVKFVHPVSPGGSVKFVASGVNFSIFTLFLCFFLLKLLKLGEIDGVRFLA